jgi:RNA polymerase sigma factor (sigma-70 family)
MLRRGLAPGAYAADLALARQCAEGDEPAWERFVLEYRPILYRAADALDPSGGARDLADSLYAELYGVGRGESSSSAPGRRSLFHYFHGRSSLATWLRAILSQRYVDRLRAQRRLEPLPDDEAGGEREGRARAKRPLVSREAPPDPERAQDVARLQHALAAAVAALPPKDRLRLACYYAQGLTLADTGRLLHEHEATASRQLARTRRAIREDVERRLAAAGLTDAQIARGFAAVAEDAGPIDLDQMLATAGRKTAPPDRSR